MRTNPWGFTPFKFGKIDTDSPEEREQSIVKFELEKWRYWQYRKAHPNRNIPYIMRCYPRIGGQDTRGFRWSSTDWALLLEVIRNLSNVSCQIRAELGKSTFTNTHLKIHSTKDLSSLSPFLCNRPSILGGIKALTKRVEITGEEAFSKRTYHELFKLIASVLKLDILDFSLVMDTSYMPLLAARKVDLPWLKDFIAAVRRIPVAKKFDFHLWSLTIDDHEFDSDESEAEVETYQEELEAKYREKIKDQLLPDTLRDATSREVTPAQKTRKTTVQK